MEPESHILVRQSTRHPRNGEADILPLRNGNLLLVYGRWNGDGGRPGSDFGPAELWSKTSHDNGKTWGEDRVIVPNEGKLTTFEAGLLRLRSGGILLSYCVKDSTEDCSICFRKSSDEGCTWPERYKYQIPVGKKYTGYTGQNNARLVRLKSGRILLPAFDGWVRGAVLRSFVLYSDDEGKSWKKGGDADIRGLAPNDRFGADEPAVVERKDGRVMMLIRTDLGLIAKSYSGDGGLTWSAGGGQGPGVAQFAGQHQADSPDGRLAARLEQQPEPGSPPAQFRHIDGRRRELAQYPVP